MRAAIAIGLVILTPRLLPEPRFPDCVCPRELRGVVGAEAPGEARGSQAVGCMLPGAGPARSLRGPARLLFGMRLDLNRATADGLESLPAIGPGRAAAILAARDQGHFARVSELERVRGIGPRTIEALAGWIGVGEPEDPVGCASAR